MRRVWLGRSHVTRQNDTEGGAENDNEQEARSERRTAQGGQFTERMQPHLSVGLLTAMVNSVQVWSTMLCTGIAVMRKSFMSQFHSESTPMHPNVAMNGAPELTTWVTLNASD